VRDVFKSSFSVAFLTSLTDFATEIHFTIRNPVHWKSTQNFRSPYAFVVSGKHLVRVCDPQFELPDEMWEMTITKTEINGTYHLMLTGNRGLRLYQLTYEQ